MGYTVMTKTEFMMGDHCVLIKCAASDGALMLAITFDHRSPVVTLFIDMHQVPFYTDVEITGLLGG